MFNKIKFFSLGVIFSFIIILPILLKAEGSLKTIDVLFNNIKLSINGNIVDTGDTQPFIYNGRTYIPARYIAENLNAEVKWNETNNTVEVLSFSNNMKSMNIESDKNMINYSIKEYQQNLDKKNYDSNKVVTPDGITNVDKWEDGKYYISFSYIDKKCKEKGYKFSNDIVTKKWQVKQDDLIIIDNVPIVYTYSSSVEYNYYVENIMPIINK